MSVLRFEGREAGAEKTREAGKPTVTQPVHHLQVGEPALHLLAAQVDRGLEPLVRMKSARIARMPTLSAPATSVRSMSPM